jgi:hypothetical protein
LDSAGRDAAASYVASLASLATARQLKAERAGRRLIHGQTIARARVEQSAPPFDERDEGPARAAVCQPANGGAAGRMVSGA